VLESLASELRRQSSENRTFKSVFDDILKTALNERRLAIIVDGLDHGAELQRVEQLRHFLELYPNCIVILAGRLYALHHHRTKERLFLDAPCWHFARLDEFDEELQRRYLGDKYSQVTDEARQLLGVPRILRYIRKMREHDIHLLKTTGDVFWHACDGLLDGGILPDAEWLKTRKKYVHQLLAAMAFQMTTMAEMQVEGGASASTFIRQLAPTSRFSLVNVDDDFRNAVADRMLHAFDDFERREPKDNLLQTSGPLAEMEQCRQYIRGKGDRLRGAALTKFRTAISIDIDDITKLQTIVGNQVHSHVFFDDEATHLADLEHEIDPISTDRLKYIIWQNRTLQEFYAAYWMSNFVIREGGLQAATGKRAVAKRPSDLERFRQWSFTPEKYESEEYYWINRFVAEMPRAAQDPNSWAVAASIWYVPGLPRVEPLTSHADSDLIAEPGIKPHEIAWKYGGIAARSSEMLFRSWNNMHRLAGWPVRDWWNVGYEFLQSTKDPNDTGRGNEVARAVLSGFFGELDCILGDPSNPSRQQIARSFVEEKNWCKVAGGEFEMGQPDRESQGFPQKTRAYWQARLAEATEIIAQCPKDPDGTRTPASAKKLYEEIDKLARRCFKRMWYFGAQGKRFYDQEIRDDCIPIFLRVETEQREVILDEIETMWRTRDETPLNEAMLCSVRQAVRDFSMHAHPVTHAAFDLFYPSHYGTTVRYLEQVVVEGHNHERKDTHPGLNHPVIYVSWYDAWAFCEWATWTDRMTGMRYNCRLPHEPEWEFASRERGTIPATQRYWWSGSFYLNDKDPMPEHLSKEIAHAIGHPGGTRATNLAEPNGLGFYDLLGNVWEWMANPYQVHDIGEGPEKKRISGYCRSLPVPGQAPAANCRRVMRGGLWYFLDLLAHCTHRFKLNSDDRDYKMGFRVVRDELNSNK
jgi:formylglycine-generating enzyme required for sulfatase activity